MSSKNNRASRAKGSGTNADHGIACEQCLEWMEMALDDRLDARYREPFDQHLTTCARCATAYQDASIVHELFEKAERPVCPEHVVGSILAQVEAHIEDDVRLAEEGTRPTADDRRPAEDDRWPAQDDRRPAVNGAPREARSRHAPGVTPVRRWLDRGLPRPAWIAVAAAAAIALLALWLPGQRSHPERVADGGPTVATRDASGHGSEAGGPTLAPAPGGSREPSEAEIELAAAEMKMALAVVSRAMMHATDIVGSEVSGSLSRPIRTGIETFLKEAPPQPTEPMNLEDGHSSATIPPRGEC